MSNWQLHEFTIAPGKRERFFDVWKSRLLPLASRHGPYVGGCWIEKDGGKFLWLVSNELRRVDDALAEDWPAMLVRQERIGTMDVSVPLIGLDAGEHESDLVDRSKGLDNQYYRLDVDTCQPDACVPFAEMLQNQLLPTLRRNDFDVVGAWRSHAGNRFFHLIGFKDEADYKSKKAALAAKSEWGQIDSALSTLPIDRNIRVLEPCRF
jgi:hypothetical protein